MKNTRRFRLGLFTLGVGAMFVSLLVFIMQSSFDNERAPYYIIFRENVKGMVIGSKVNFQGVPIGVVADMRFQDGNTLVELRVDPTRASIQDVTKARMDRLLVTGQVTVELEGYDGSGNPLSPGSFIEAKEDPLNSLKASLPEVVAQAADVLSRLDRVLANAEVVIGSVNQAKLTGILTYAEEAMQGLSSETMPEVTAMIRDARSTIQAAEGTANATTSSVEAVAATLKSVERVEQDLHTLLRESTAIVTGVRGPTLATLSGFRTTLDDLRGLLRQLKLAPDSLLFGVSRPASPLGGSR